MARDSTAVKRLKSKYGAKAVDNMVRLHPRDFAEQIAWRDEMDPQATRLQLEYSYGGLIARGVLDERTRMLVLIAQCAAAGELEYLESTIRAALDEGVAAREILEILLQTTVYVGMPRINRAARVFYKIVRGTRHMVAIKKSQPPIEGRNAERSLEAERQTWGVSDERFANREELLKKYGWHGISAGLRLQPTHHAEAVMGRDRLDQHFLKHWLDYIYGGMYVRGVLDDKTRVLCVVGVCTALDEMPQNENHIRNALLLGATPREVMEVTVQSTQYWGMPRSLRAMTQLENVLREQGRLAELTNTQLPLPA
jgi:alkylhydroperoxidase/carboxymuconolactone decarboxylase family protein YurZ